MGPAAGALGFAQAVSKTAVESVRRVWMVFMMVFLKEWGSRRRRQQNGDARQEMGRHLGDPDSKSALRNGLRSGLQGQTMGSRSDGRSHVRGYGGVYPQLNCGGCGHGWRPSPRKHAHPTRTAVGEGLIDLGDGQRCFITEPQASRINRVALCAVMALCNRFMVW